MMIKQHERVILTADLPDHRLKTGDVGTVVHIYRAGEAYEVEFFTLDGQTLAVVTVDSDRVRPIATTDILHARSVR